MKSLHGTDKVRITTTPGPIVGAPLNATAEQREERARAVVRLEQVMRNQMKRRRVKKDKDAQI